MSDPKNSAISSEMIQAVGTGDPNAFRTLYSLARVPVYGYALSMLHNPQDAEDAAEDAFLQIRESASRYRPQGKPMAWIYTIVKNICLMQFRNRKKEAEEPADPEREIPQLDKIQNAENRMVLAAAMQVLSREECQIILLHAVSGRKHREIAELLDLPLSTVLSKYSRGLQKLRQKLEEPL